MINLRRFYENHFDTKNIGDDRLRKFTADHIQRLVSNDTAGKYEALKVEVSTAYDDYFGAITTEDISFSEQQALTLSKNQTLIDFIELVRQKEGLVRGTWGKQSPEYKEFFPSGIGEYSKANLSTVENLMKRMITVATKHKDELGQPFLDLFTNVHSDFVRIREQQLQKFGTVSTSKQTTRAKRDVLTEQLMKNLLTIAVDSIGEPRRLSEYFDQSIVRRSSRESVSQSQVEG